MEEVVCTCGKNDGFKSVCGYASFMGFLVYQMDVKECSSIGRNWEKVYVTQPPGFKDPDHPDKVYKVVKALYGLHQAPRAWYETLANYLLSNVFKRGKIDQTLFIKKQKGDILLVQVYVDDIIFGSTNKELCTGFEKLMKDKFQMSSMGLEVSDDVDIFKLSYDISSLSSQIMFRYLKGKPTLGLWYSRDSALNWMLILKCAMLVGTPRYLSLVVPLTKVGDEAVHKELGDRMERAATTASSLEAEQDSALVDKNRVIVTESSIRRDLHLDDAEVNLIIYTSCIEQFWTTAKVQTVNRVRQLQALVDKKRVIVTESSIRRDLHLDDAEGTDCLPTATIFEELARMGYEKPSQKLTFYKAFFSPQWKYFIHTITQCLSAKSTAWNEFSSSMASLIICLATNQKFNLSKYIFDAMVKHLDGGVKFLLYPRFLQVFINQQLGNMSTHKKIFVNPFHTKKVFANMKRAGKDFSRRITPLFDTMMVQPVEEMGEDSDHPTDSTLIHIIDQPSSSSQPKKDKPSKKAQDEAEVPQDEAEHEESVPTPSNDPQPSGEDSMQLTNLMVLCTKLQTQVLDLQKAKDAQAKEIAALKKRIQRLERRKMSRPTGLKRLRKVGMSRRVESSEDQESLGAPEDASKQGRSIEDIDADVDDDEMHVEAKVDGKDEQSTKPDDNKAFKSSIRDITFKFLKIKEKVIYDEPEVPLKRKRSKLLLMNKIAKRYSAKLGVELLEEQKLAREKEEEANIALIELWENTQAMMEADRLLVKRLQSKEREKFNRLRKKAKLFMENNGERESILLAPQSTRKKKQTSYQGTKENSNLIRADGSFKRYSSMIRMLQGIDREDLEALWRIVKAKYGDTRPDNEFERVLWGDLKVMFEPEQKEE
ncbi:putative ribonuclease H-like domain-containing protein [Tanacetum coccineum]